ncbi:hypothetical protein JMA_39560 (plasmid) [Jeotgalibacillus malaysiensis]|uniref:Uncharacterized protein n=1 Tax=Jeotgalibacillus malaysiensis TaxID=1508404 RepID=A0A0B5AZA1_9BACL|nr:hypothetical protein [Jeotgalibacillus malaysiensis]AJD93274.1 hypothetical protein JMA_39560 [Jeotgalibacillus malaysiensis]
MNDIMISSWVTASVMLIIGLAMITLFLLADKKAWWKLSVLTMLIAIVGAGSVMWVALYL